jgi:N-acetylmuramoyl-L-alanine amidase CwlA|nr:MAG TPA: N-acetylmuramoyl-L-alanine amidase [Caudoviricetes sp.]
MESLETGSLFVYKNERQVENMSYKITNAISSNRVPAWGNKKKYIAVHYLGVVGQNHDLASDGCGAHFYIYWDGTIYQRCSLDAVPWAVGTAGYYAQKHPEANNYNTISIEMCCKCDGNAASANDPTWYFTQETQEACVWLVKQLMGQLGIAADHVLRHYDIVNKVCPAPYVHNNHYNTSWTWNEFKKKIAGSGDILPATTKPWYRVRKTWKNASSQIGAFKTIKKAKQCADQHAGYHVYNDAGKKVYTSAKLPYKVRPKTTNVPIRTGPAKTYSAARTFLQSGKYEIVEEKNGFGKLKSGAGWVYLKKVERV